MIMRGKKLKNTKKAILRILKNTYTFEIMSQTAFHTKKIFAKTSFYKKHNFHKNWGKRVTEMFNNI